MVGSEPYYARSGTTHPVQLRLNRQVHGGVLTGLDLDPLSTDDAAVAVHLNLVAARWSSAEKFTVWPRQIPNRWPTLWDLKKRLAVVGKPYGG